MKELKENKQKYICPDCSICDCDKIKYTNINNASEVELGLYVRKIYQSSEQGVVRKTKDVDFTVYECKRFKKYNSKELFDERVSAKEVVRIYKEILELRSEVNAYKSKETVNKLLSLVNLKRELYNSIKDKNIKEELDRKLEKIKKEHLKELSNSLKLTIK